MPIESLPFVRRFVPGPVPPETPASITVTITESPTENPKVHLSGSGDNWSTSVQGIHLTPTVTPVRYRLILQLESSLFSLVGAQIYRTSFENESTQHATLFFPVVVEKVEINLLHDIGRGGVLVSYQLFIGIKDAIGNVFWPDPTIAFEPQAGPPSPMWPEER